MPLFHYTQAESNRLQLPNPQGSGRVGVPRQMRTLNVQVALPHDRCFYDKKPDQPDPLSTIPSGPNSCRGQIAKDGPDHWAGPPDQLRIFGPVFDRFDALLTPAPTAHFRWLHRASLCTREGDLHAIWIERDNRSRSEGCPKPGVEQPPSLMQTGAMVHGQ